MHFRQNNPIPFAFLIHFFLPWYGPGLGTSGLAQAVRWPEVNLFGALTPIMPLKKFPFYLVHPLCVVIKIVVIFNLVFPFQAGVDRYTYHPSINHHTVFAVLQQDIASGSIACTLLKCIYILGQKQNWFQYKVFIIDPRGQQHLVICQTWQPGQWF